MLDRMGWYKVCLRSNQYAIESPVSQQAFSEKQMS